LAIRLLSQAIGNYSGGMAKMTPSEAIRHRAGEENQETTDYRGWGSSEACH
jgi:hypothetical protein